MTHAGTLSCPSKRQHYLTAAFLLSPTPIHFDVTVPLPAQSPGSGTQLRLPLTATNLINTASRPTVHSAVTASMSRILRNPNNGNWASIGPLLASILFAFCIYSLATANDWTGEMEPNAMIYHLGLCSLYFSKRTGVLKVVLICATLTLSLCLYFSIRATESLFIMSNVSWLSMLTAMVCGGAYNWWSRRFSENKRRSEIYHVV